MSSDPGFITYHPAAFFFFNYYLFLFPHLQKGNDNRFFPGIITSLYGKRDNNVSLHMGHLAIPRIPLG